MKTRLPVCLALCLCVQLSQADDAPSIHLRAVRARTSHARSTSWRTSYGSYHKSSNRSLAVSIDVRNIGGEQADIIVQTFFLAKGKGRDSGVFVFDRQLAELSLDPRGMTNLVHSSRELTEETQHYEALRRHYNQGAEMDGYIVRVLADGIVLKAEASSVRYRKLAEIIELDQALAEL